MFDIGAPELLMIIVVAVIVIGPKDLPLAMRTAGRWLGKIRRISGHFRAGMETMIREAELEEMEKKWADQNKRIMADHPNEVVSETGMSPGEGVSADETAASADARAAPTSGADTEAPDQSAQPAATAGQSDKAVTRGDANQGQLPLGSSSPKD